MTCYVQQREEELLDDARFHVNETETALDDARRASDIHQERTGKALDLTEENIRKGQFPEKDKK